MITLVSPRLTIQKSDFLGSGVPYWPLELAVFAAFLKNQKEDVRVIDLFGDDVRSLEDAGDHYLQGAPIAAYLQSEAVRQADALIVFAISSMSHREILSICKTLKAERGKPVFILENSQAVTAYAVDQKADDFFAVGVDGLIAGEPYWNWPQLKAFITGIGPAPENVMTKTGAAVSAKRLTNKNPSYPVPAWDLFNLRGYWALPYAHGPKTKTYLPIFTSRGCPYPCDFCVVPETNDRLWRGRPADEVANEMIELKQRFGVVDFQVEDLNPTVSKARMQSLCEELIRRDANIRFYVVSGTKAETVGLDQVDLFARAGCRYLSISPESGSTAVMKAIGKPFDYEHGAKLVEACHRAGITTQACFVVGHPEEKDDDFELSKAYLRRLVRAGLDEAAIFVLAPLPGSRLSQENRIPLSDPERLVSFSPKGRTDWKILERRRGELIRLFLVEKMKRLPSFIASGLRALVGCPRSKMENLVWRVPFIYWLIFRSHVAPRRTAS